MSNLWLLPDGIEELLPQDAMRLERMRRQLIDICYSHGYDLVSPSLLEHLDSLLSGVGEDLELETFKLIDHASGRQLGIRADMTPQIARIDAHILKSELPARLCYAGPVLRARPKKAFESRELFQLGAELYGSSNPLADVEIIELMISCLGRCGLSGLHLDIGHVGVFRTLAVLAGLDAEAEMRLFDALQRKSVPDLAELVDGLKLPSNLARAFVDLPEMRGAVADFESRTAHLRELDDSIAVELENLSRVVDPIRERYQKLDVYFDLAELRGYHYHTGVVFSAFYEGLGRELARGGRYDAIGAVYGRSRPATGFSLDLRQILKLAGDDESAKDAIFAPAIDADIALDAEIERLRAAGERVERCLNGDGHDFSNRSRRLVRQGDGWTVKNS